jgi:hypothetical protein
MNTIEKIDFILKFRGKIDERPLIQGILRSGDIDIYFQNGKVVRDVEIVWEDKNPVVFFDNGRLNHYEEEEVNNYLSEHLSQITKKLSVFIDEIDITLLTFTIPRTNNGDEFGLDMDKET